MSRKLYTQTALGLILGSTAMAEAPSVAVDIAPVHSLVARVMDGVGAPNLIIPPGASPHEYSLRPSEAQSLQDADIVFWIGEDLTPWLEKSIDTLSQNAEITTLLDQSETKLLK
ncbi:MAG: DNA primase, partial [Rhodobacterales bacterium]|nr:DNA primase [Rhodobacterales bacterium]